MRYQTNITKLANILNDNYIQKNIVLLNVFYSDLATVYVEEVPEVKVILIHYIYNWVSIRYFCEKITTDALFGNIGGNLGLFIGMSILSFVEIFEMMVEVFKKILLNFCLKIITFLIMKVLLVWIKHKKKHVALEKIRY